MHHTRISGSNHSFWYVGYDDVKCTISHFDRLAWPRLCNHYRLLDFIGSPHRHEVFATRAIHSPIQLSDAPFGFHGNTVLLPHKVFGADDCA